MNYAGIDVSHKEVVMVVNVKGKVHQAKTFDNTPSGHQSIIKRLSRLKGETRVCLEATGIYYFDLAVVLSRAAGMEVMVINPRVSHNFSLVMMQRSKTDVTDAHLLTIYCERMPFVVWQRPADEKLSLRAIGRRIATLNKMKAQTKNQLHALNATEETPGMIIKHTEELISMLVKQINAHRDSALTLIQQHAELTNVFILITSIKGIAQASAIQLLAELVVLPSDMNARQWVAYAGLDPRQFQSGSSVAKKPRISKAGNRFIRQSLYMPALVATRHEPHIKAYYEHLIEENGLKKMQAVCAVMRKLLHAIHSIMKSGKPFEGQRFYRMPVEANLQ